MSSHLQPRKHHKTSRFQQFSNSKYGVEIAIWLAHRLSAYKAARLARWLANTLVSNRSSPLVQSIRLNQWVVRGENATAEELDQAAREVLLHAGRCVYDLYRNMRHPERLKALAPETPISEELVARSRDKSFGAFVVAPHLSNFDVVLLANAYRGLHAQVLTYAKPTSGYQIQNRIRAETGLDITPVNEASLRKAVRTMREGGFVVTAVDRPSKRRKPELRFFGHPAPLPYGYVRLAMEGGVPILVATAFGKPDGTYGLRVSDPIAIPGHHEDEDAVRENAEKVLGIIEGYIRMAPSQWLMYYPVWPQLFGEVPG